MEKKRGQVSIFVLLAILIVAVILIYFAVRPTSKLPKIPSEFEPVYGSFLECVEEATWKGINLLESQAGYIELPEFEPGSEQFPFSSHLDFVGVQVPYWRYVSANGLEKERVPSLEYMETQLEDFIESEISDCSFESFYDEGFGIIIDSRPEAKVKIKPEEVDVELHANLTLSKGGSSYFVNMHHLEIPSVLGSLYNSAKKIYNYEKESLFLENRTIDVLRLYAPVDGFEISCSPLTWNADEIFDELENALEANILALRTNGPKNDYFNVELPVSEQVKFLNFKNWPRSFEVSPADGKVLLAEPIGNQPGLGILGFCYVPYHFVYSLRYPVLIQISKSGETFQFPVAIIIEKNVPRGIGVLGEAVNLERTDLCKNKNTRIRVELYDNALNPVKGEIFYKCLGSECYIGETGDNGVLEADFPQCVNGQVIVKAENYKDAKKVFSTVNPGTVQMILDKEYLIEVELVIDGRVYDGEDAIINFISEDGSQVLVYPKEKYVKLGEGEYNISVLVYGEGNFKLGETTFQHCIDVPTSFFSIKTKERCFDVVAPEQEISKVLIAGGNAEKYFLESSLRGAEKLKISLKSLPTPESLEDLQENYMLVRDKKLELSLE